MAGTRCSHSSRNISELLVEYGKTFLVGLMEVKLMCTGIVENTRVSGSGRGPEGWFRLEQAIVSYDHPDHTPSERAVIIDFLNVTAGPESRVAVELTPESAKNLVHAILASLSRGEGSEARTRDESSQ
jgi:Family of unknown function (DUF6295)